MCDGDIGGMVRGRDREYGRKESNKEWWSKIEDVGKPFIK